MPERARPLRRPDHKLEVIEGEVLVFHPAESRVLYCNETGSMIWQLCDGTRSVDQITELLQEAFPENAVQVEADVRRALQEFERLGFIRFIEE